MLLLQLATVHNGKFPIMCWGTSLIQLPKKHNAVAVNVRKFSYVEDNEYIQYKKLIMQLWKYSFENVN